jgi:tRNA (cmo5U34)-methyltransferase
MSHSVQQHLAVSADEYDREIVRFVFAYQAMIDEVVATLLDRYGADAALHVLDLGAGTGALSARVAAALPRARLTLLDADAAMLARAAERLRPFGDRARAHHGSFFDPLPPCDVAVASLSLHHVHDPAQKRALYGAIRAALAAGGALVSADVTIPRAPGLAERAYARWAAHLVAAGDTEAQAYARFADWSKEDRYFALEEELAMLREAGFASAEAVWREGPSTVLVATLSP